MPPFLRFMFNFDRIDLGRQELDWLEIFLEEGYMYEVPWKNYAAFVAAPETHEFRPYVNA